VILCLKQGKGESQALLQALLGKVKRQAGGKNWTQGGRSVSFLDVISLPTCNTVWQSSLITPWDHFPPQGDCVLKILEHSELVLEAKQAAGKTHHSWGSSAQALPSSCVGLAVEPQPPTSLAHYSDNTASPPPCCLHIITEKLVLRKWE